MKFKETLRLCSGQAGFTLIELIIVIAIIALLAAATFVAVNPAKRIGDANNAQRWSDVIAIADAWATYIADNTGTAPVSFTSGVTYAIATTTGGTFGSDACLGSSGATTTTALISLGTLVTNGYIGTVPTDPALSPLVDRTDYYLYAEDSSGSGVLKVGACHTYDSAEIEVIR